MGYHLDRDKLDPENERALSEAMDKAIDVARAEGLASVSRYMRDAYDSFRAKGFTRVQAYAFTILLYKSLLDNRG